ncbi:hypothetical protein B0I35DRAFT_363310 [Stachybotrys elegans]|uniref:F-box domain-containing protein n=1 Tax=Stachybotrys elegans TaxID=80388 RepID=A0A8K0WJK7_9HYPO|nr:hypothetical protein B0I35DRAFT_363310 [Stachybotrys elegans]
MPTLTRPQIVYRNGPDSDFNGTGTYISGVGLSDNVQIWTPPRDSSQRWDSMIDPNQRLQVPIVPCGPGTGPYGFALHDSCWNLLQKASHPMEISLERFVDACLSLPFPRQRHGVEWGQDFGGILTLASGRDRFPWNDIYHPTEGPSPPATIGVSNPFDGAHVFDVLSTVVEHAPSGCMSVFKSASHLDPFSRLPRELQQNILENLGTRDALNLRLVSRSFHHLFYSHAFWSSRFHPDGENGHLFEVWGITQSKTAEELLHLYRLFGRHNFVSKPETISRGRVWKLARGLLPVLQTPRVHKLPSLQTSWSGCTRWISINRGARLSLQELDAPADGSVPTTVIDMNIPDGAMEIRIAVLNAGYWDYITGIRLIDGDGREQMAGYSFENETICHVTAFHGFCVGMALGGVRALQVIGKGRQVSNWAGRVDRHVPQSERLIMKQPVRGLRVTLDATFQGYKVTALAVCGSQRNSVVPLTSMNIRHAAIWYPGLPPRNVCFNQDSFAGHEPLSGDFQPLSWIHFGGGGGSSLGHITGINYCQEEEVGNIVDSFCFTYGGAHQNRQSEPLGPDKGSWTKFWPIDGAGGERIVSLAIDTHVATAPCRFYASSFDLALETNRGRTLLLNRYSHQKQMRPVRFATGTVITGFYGHYHRGYGFVSLGVISEHVDLL